MLFDELLTGYVGEMGLYQILILIICSSEELSISTQTMSAVFTGATPDHYCRHPNISLLNNCSDQVIRKWTLPEGDAGKCFYLSEFPRAEGISGSDDICHAYNVSNIPETWSNGTREACTEWIFDETLYSHTMVTEWHLVCEDSWKPNLLSSMYLAGMPVGAFTIGWLADRYGRRLTSFMAGIPHVVVGVVLALVPGFYEFVAIRFIHGALASGKTTLSFIIAMEYCGRSKRVLVGVVYTLVWAAGYVLTTGVAYGLRNWRHIMLAITLPEVIYYVLLYLFVPETPRWLYVTNRREEADAVVRKMARINKRKLPDVLDVTEPPEDAKVNPLNMCKTPRMLKVTIVLLFVWAANGMTYYGISLNTQSLAGDPYVNFAISGLIEIPAYLFILFTFTLMGRIWPFALSMIIAGLSLFAILIVPEDMPQVVTGLAMTGKFFITATYTMAYIYTPEVYPTSIRSIGININNIAAKVAAPLSPFVLLLAVIHPTVPTIIFGTMSVAAGIMLLPMPETKGQPMVQTIEEADILLKHTPSGLTCCKRRGRRSSQNVDEILQSMQKKKDHDNGTGEHLMELNGTTQC